MIKSTASAEREKLKAQNALAFMEVAADWAEQEGLDLIFVRDEGLWCAVIRMRDRRGPYQATVDLVIRRPDDPAVRYKRAVTRELRIALERAREARKLRARGD